VGAGRSAGRRWLRVFILRLVILRLVWRRIKLGIVRRIRLFATATASATAGAHGAAAKDRAA
jgi:hypothetical protein